jgi:cysteinyl-tRNA synthetase
MLKVFNTLTGQKEIFEPLKPKTVGMYACGVTVYDYSHLGHARSALVFDVIRKYLQHSGYAVQYVRNFTDVDDKIINRASEEGKTSEEITEKYLLAYQEDMKRLGVAPADVEPKATEHIPDIITMIQTLIAKGHAYRLNGDVYYEVKTYPTYGRLSKRKAEDLLAGARVEVDERKRNPMDFALWKAAKAGEPAWPSPWGPGRPGWHIECSAMAIRHLGETFDIHGGGQDLIFPHHENEIAQSCAATGKEFARYWIHNGFVQINQEKMSKSLGNFFTVKEIFEKFPANEKVTAEVLRYFLLSTQYRSPIDFSDEALRQTRAGLNNFYDLFLRLEEITVPKGVADKEVGSALKAVAADFERAMDDDFNTPAALAALQTIRSQLNTKLAAGLSSAVAQQALTAIRRYGKVLGLFQVPVRDWEFGTALSDDYSWSKPIVQPTVPPKQPIPGGQDDLPGDAAIERQIAERNEARHRKDFARADAIRKELAAKGIILEDRPDGTTRWKR